MLLKRWLGLTSGPARLLVGVDRATLRRRGGAGAGMTGNVAAAGGASGTEMAGRPAPKPRPSSASSPGGSKCYQMRLNIMSRPEGSSMLSSPSRWTPTTRDSSSVNALGRVCSTRLETERAGDETADGGGAAGSNEARESAGLINVKPKNER